MEIQMIRGLASPSYDTAKQVIELINANDFASAVAVLGGLSSVELMAIRDKVIVLGTEENLAAFDSVIQTLGKTEVIYVTDVIKKAKQPWPLWLKIALGVAGFGLLAGAAYWYKTRQSP